jgi:hypothetical protein
MNGLTKKIKLKIFTQIFTYTSVFFESNRTYYVN